MTEGSSLRAVIVDDEEPARALLREYLADVPEIEVAAECANGFEAVKAIAEHRPELVLLDIQMPKLDGFEVLELVDEPVEVIFTTAYDQFALKAFEVHAIDYLLKPFGRDRLLQALERARQRLAAPQPDSLAPLLKATRLKGVPIQRILVREGSRVEVLPTDNIDFVEAQDDYVRLCCGGVDHRKQQTLAAVEELLDPTCFVRIHRSYIVNVERLASIEQYAKDSRLVILKDGTKLPVSRAGYARLRTLL